MSLNVTDNHRILPPTSSRPRKLSISFERSSRGPSSRLHTLFARRFNSWFRWSWHRLHRLSSPPFAVPYIRRYSPRLAYLRNLRPTQGPRSWNINRRFVYPWGLYETVDIKPSFVQVHFHPETHFEVPLRNFCREKGIAFQAHKVLKGKKEDLLRDELIVDLANILGVTNEVS